MAEVDSTAKDKDHEGSQEQSKVFNDVRAVLVPYEELLHSTARQQIAIEDLLSGTKRVKGGKLSYVMSTALGDNTPVEIEFQQIEGLWLCKAFKVGQYHTVGSEGIEFDPQGHIREISFNYAAVDPYKPELSTRTQQLRRLIGFEQKGTLPIKEIKLFIRKPRDMGVDSYASIREGATWHYEVGTNGLLPKNDVPFTTIVKTAIEILLPQDMVLKP